MAGTDTGPDKILVKATQTRVLLQQIEKLLRTTHAAKTRQDWRLKVAGEGGLSSGSGEGGGEKGQCASWEESGTEFKRKSNTAFGKEGTLCQSCCLPKEELRALKPKAAEERWRERYLQRRADS